MTQAEPASRPRRFIAGIILCGIGLVLFAVSVALFLVCLAGIGLLVAGMVSWLHPVDVAAAWARTLAGVGLIGGSAGIGALGWLGVERLVGPLGRFAQLRRRPRHFAAAGEDAASGAPARVARAAALRRIRKFVAIIGILSALICLPFAAAIHESAHAPWFGWGDASGSGA